MTAGNWSIESSEKSILSGVDWLWVSSGVSVRNSSMARSIVGCGTLFVVILVGDLVVGCVSFCGVSFIVFRVANCDSYVSSIIAHD